jgi:FkbM family methyltransferase
MEEICKAAGLTVMNGMIVIPDWVKHVKLDIGMGRFPIYSREWLKKEPDTLIFGFEPCPDALKNIHENWIITKEQLGRNVFVLPIALSSSPNSSLDFYVTTPASESSSLYRPKQSFLDHYQFQTEKITVPSFTLQEFLELLPASQLIEYIKIDAQGADLDIVQSGKNMISERVVYLTLEADDHQYENCDSNAKKTESYMSSIGFDVVNHPNTEDLTYLNCKFASIKDDVFICQKLRHTSRIPGYCVLDPVYQIKETSAGLMHQLTMLVVLYLHCKANNLIPVLPRLILAGGHNEGRAKLLKDYIDLPDDFVSEIPIDTRGQDIDISVNTQLPSNIRSHIQRWFPFRQKFRTIAERVVKDLPRPLLCVRVRRGDMLYCRPDTHHKTTSIENIKSVLKRYTYNTVYIMTDEKDLTYFDPIEKKSLYRDFKELVDLKAEDNYELYCVESYIRDLSDIRISTFTTHDDDDYFHGYLADMYGVH